VLRELGIADEVLLWNAVPTHPGTESSNRRPTRVEIDAGSTFLRALARGRRAIAVGRVAHAVLGGEYVRHPSRGGANEFHRRLDRVASATARRPVERGVELTKPLRLDSNGNAMANRTEAKPSCS
jgi:hypothetical protein